VSATFAVTESTLFSGRVLVAVILGLFALGPVRAAEAQPSDPQLLRAMLQTAGVDAEELARREMRVLAEVDRIEQRLGEGRPGYRRARRLHRILHRDYFREYIADADDVYGMIENGRYNCLSASLLYGLIARRMGYRPEIIKLPGHLLIRLQVRGESVDVETTSLWGFNLPQYTELRPIDPGMNDIRRNRLQWPRNSPAFGPSVESRWQISLEQAIGYAWVNRGWRLIEAGQAPAAARCVKRAGEHLGRLAVHEETVRRLLVEAFGIEYESGRFQNAFEVAAIDATLFPQRTTSRDRLLAASVKRVELLCEAGAPHVAMRLLDEVQELCGSSGDLDRFRRRISPLIAAAAVRLSRWELARRAAGVYVDVEPDRVESARLMQWVEHRSQGLPESYEDVSLRP